MRTGRLRSIFYGLIAVVIAAGCSEVKETEKADLQFWLTDMPGEYQQVNIDVQQVNVILNDSLIELATNQGIYNLLDFVNGKLPGHRTLELIDDFDVILLAFLACY